MFLSLYCKATVRLLKANGSVGPGYKTPDPVPLTTEQDVGEVTTSIVIM